MLNDKKIVFSRKLSDSSSVNDVLDDLLIALGGLEDKAGPGDIVLIKPNFVAPFPKATTDLVFIDFFIDKIRQCGATPVVGETSGYEFDTEGTFKILGVDAFLKQKGVELINFETQQYVKIDIGQGFKPVEVAEIATQAKLIINLPVLKGHSITKVTGATKNLFGFLSKSSRRYLHCHRLENSISALARYFTNVIHIVDARHLLSRAVFGEPAPLGFCLAGKNSFAIDHFGSKLLGISPDSVKYLSDTPGYEIDGALPGDLTDCRKEDSLKQKLHRAMYVTFYFVDYIKCKVFKGESIIPSLHWYLGIHPEIGSVSDEELKILAGRCPVGAIDVEKRKIIREKCIKVRCLQCYCQAEPEKIVLKGFGRPKGNKK
ncbi:MAG: DUF362 domain-containing protein [Anaerohalosphaeraceae bacterium]|nr:DUF362 domain-containing protein [Anaerohalosphaeraceae bacterium]